MSQNKINDILLPQIQNLPQAKSKEHIDPKAKEEFQSLLKAEVDKTQKEHGIQLSLHAAKRIKERNLPIDGPEYLKIKTAIEKLKNKGGQDSLVVTPNAAYIVDVGNNRIVTAMDKEQIAENVFTKIDSTVILNE